MKHNYIKLMLPVLLSIVSLSASAHNFEVGGIYYNITSSTDLTVAVTKRNGSSNSYSGQVSIPETVAYNEKTYRVTSIGDYAFSDCSGLTSVTIPNSVTSIGDYAFYKCSGLTSVTIPNSVTSIGSYAFSGTGWYNNQPDGILYLDEWLIGVKGEKLTGIFAIAEGTRGLAGSAFRGCSGLTSITIPNSVTSIGDNAFYGCSGLTSVTIPNSVTSIGRYAFSGCSGLTSVTIGNSVTSIGGSAFRECSGLTSVTIPNSVTSIGSEAFSNCRSLTSVTIGNSVTTIGNNAFHNCSRLTSVTIGNSVTSIESDAFYGTNLKKTIWLTNTPPSGYTDAAGAVNYVANEQYTNLSNKTVYPFLSSIFEVDGVKYVPVSPSERTCDAIDCVYDSTAEHTKILSTVNYHGVTLNVLDVKPYVCYNNKYIKNVELSKDFTYISNYAFANCSELQSIIIPDSARTIGSNAFENCNSISSITIPKATTDIKDNVFNGCTGLKTVIIVNREAELKLGSNGSSPLFASCPLDSVYIGGNITYSTNQNKGYSPFYRNAKLRSVTITDKETEISQNEFYGCTNLQNVRIGDGVTTIGDWAFSGCSSLSYFAFGTQVNSIGKEAFSDCTNVGRIISKAEVPPVCGSQALDDINKWSCQLSVPKGCLSVYQAADQWKDFFFVDEKALEENIIDNPDTPDTPVTQKCATPTIAFANGKLTFTCETEGVEYAYEVTNVDVKKGLASEVVIDGTYKVSVYATKTGYENSDVATMEFTLGAIGGNCDVNGDGAVDVADISAIINEMASRARMQEEATE